MLETYEHGVFLGFLGAKRAVGKRPALGNHRGNRTPRAHRPHPCRASIRRSLAVKTAFNSCGGWLTLASTPKSFASNMTSGDVKPLMTSHLAHHPGTCTSRHLPELHRKWMIDAFKVVCQGRSSMSSTPWPRSSLKAMQPWHHPNIQPIYLNKIQEEIRKNIFNFPKYILYKYINFYIRKFINIYILIFIYHKFKNIDISIFFIFQ